MLGQYAVKSLGPATDGDFQGENLAFRLLAELINRGLSLRPAHLYAIGAEYPAERLERLEDLAAAVSVFLLDVEEARARGVGADLFGGGSFGEEVDDACAVSDELRKDVGAFWDAVALPAGPHGKGAAA